jgi:uncharacterized repeat protein (TIGR03837 family)
MLWDIFCKVIDNHGDIGVCWRVAAELAARGERIRLWVDDPSALAWMAPQGHAGVQVVHWTQAPPQVEPGDVVVEAFGCDPPPAFVAALAAKSAARGRQPPWINLEYLSAEPYVERSHGLPSPVMDGPAKGLTKQFFYPGFTARTGGLLREQDLASRQAAFDPASWRAALGIRAAPGTRLASLFCYEPAALPQWLAQLAQGPVPTLLLVTAGRAQRAVASALAGVPPTGRLAVHQLPLLSQRDYDHLLWSCDLNFVRGEDSLVRALWAAKPFIWHIYPQDDGAHQAKLDAFLDWLQAPSSLRQFHGVWNGLGTGPLPPAEMDAWAATAELARTRALQLPELAAGLLRQATRAATI